MIVLAGMIGVGKSSYTEMMARHLGTKAFYEAVNENPILEKFYDNQKEWSFSLQIYFLNQRLESIKEASTNRNNVLDRSIYEDLLFADVLHRQGNMSKEDLDIYQNLLANMMEELPEVPKKSPDLLVYLEADFETILRHIKMRDRSFEQIDHDPELLEYYRTLHESYSKWYEDYDYSPKMKISVDEYDIIANPNNEEKVMAMIEEKLAEVR